MLIIGKLSSISKDSEQRTNNMKSIGDKLSVNTIFTTPGSYNYSLRPPATTENSFEFL